MFLNSTAVSFADEFKNIQEWAKQNRLKINISKTKEITFHRPIPHKHHLPAPLLDIEQVSNCKLFGMIISSSLSVRDHVDYIIKVYNQRLYLLNKLKHAGLDEQGLATVYFRLLLYLVFRMPYQLGLGS